MTVRSMAKSKPYTYKVTWYPVRCCCSPQKIFGFLPLPHQLVKQCKNQAILKDRNGKSHQIELRTLYNGINEVNLTEELAVYSDDMPIEFWRTMPGFKELQADG
jgi:hypothetical protein